MDPVNKWLTVIICMFIAMICVVGWKAGSGRYEITTMESSHENHQVVYVLDTKTGKVTASLHDQGTHFTEKGKKRDYAVVVKTDSDDGRKVYDYGYRSPTTRHSSQQTRSYQQ